MKKALKRIEGNVYHYRDGVRIEGAPSRVTSDLSGIRGDLTGIFGDIDDCKITEEEREKGISVEDLIV